MKKTLLKVENISIYLKKKNIKNCLVENISFELKEGECLGILGESGSGKSLTCKSIMGLLDSKTFFIEGKAIYNGENLLECRGEELRKLRGKEIAMILQNPMTCFDPLYTVGYQIAETFTEHTSYSAEEIKKKSIEILEKMQLKNPEDILLKFPHQLSGGQLQRVCIARAVATNPQFILLDEAISSLDASTQTQVMDLLKDLQKKYGLSYIFITHDLPSVTYMCDRVLFFYEGNVVEEVEDIYKLSQVKSPYAKKLLNSILEINVDE